MVLSAMGQIHMSFWFANQTLNIWNVLKLMYTILQLGIAYGKGGIITERQYATDYYRDFLYYARTKNPEAIIWARYSVSSIFLRVTYAYLFVPLNYYAHWFRPVDTYNTPFPLQFAPQDVMISGWVGDQRGNFDGLKGGANQCYKCCL